MLTIIEAERLTKLVIGTKITTTKMQPDFTLLTPVRHC
jgi:hypothetical protein